MAQISLGPWRIIRDVASSSNLVLIMAAGQEANGDNLGKYFRLFDFLNNNGMLNVLIRIAWMRRFVMGTHNIQ